ncbi:MAG: hypothetical protein N3E48_01415 [Candidatus Bathyarchaeota archaeon]|nr:hypothetical protein [Candidatus Bathyarchaeota archaeon]
MRRIIDDLTLKTEELDMLVDRISEILRELMEELPKVIGLADAREGGIV